VWVGPWSVFFQHIHLRVAAFNNPFHRCWNDLRAAYKASKRWLTIALTTLVANVAYGPWNWEKRFSGMLDARRERASLLTDEDPLFDRLYGRILHDRGASDEECVPGMRESVRKSFLFDGLEHKRAPGCIKQMDDLA